MKAEIISIETPTVPIDGLFYETVEPAAGSALFMHGNTMNFYVGAPRFLPPVLVPRGIACLAYNRRGHDVLSTYASRVLVGGAFQSVAEAVEDNRLAAAWLARQGHKRPVPIGHSHGGMLAAHFAAHHPETPALVLLSATRGGPEVMRATQPGGTLTAGRFDEFFARAEAMVAEGRGRDLIIMPGWYHAISAATFVDAATNLPRLIDLAPRIACPVLFIRGSQEAAEAYPAEAFAKACAGPCDVAVIDRCDHFYGGHESEIADLVTGFLARTL